MSARIQLLVFFGKQIDVVLLAGCLTGISRIERLVEVGVGIIVRQRTNDIGHVKLQYDVHTALQVKPQGHLHFAALLQRIGAEPDLLVGQ